MQLEDSANKSAMNEVFGIAELLEEILLMVPERDLLLSQRTCRRFRESIQGSLKLQRRLFLLPDPDQRETPPVPNPLLMRIYECRRADPSAGTTDFAFRHDGELYIIDGSPYLSQYSDVVWELLLLDSTFVVPKRIHDLEGSSMMNMCFSQPPTDVFVKRQCILCQSFERAKRTSAADFRVRCVTVGGVFAEIARRWKENPEKESLVFGSHERWFRGHWWVRLNMYWKKDDVVTGEWKLVKRGKI